MKKKRKKTKTNHHSPLLRFLHRPLTDSMALMILKCNKSLKPFSKYTYGTHRLLLALHRLVLPPHLLVLHRYRTLLRTLL
jgi:hypothetical protein